HRLRRLPARLGAARRQSHRQNDRPPHLHPPAPDHQKVATVRPAGKVGKVGTHKWGHTYGDRHNGAMSDPLCMKHECQESHASSSPAFLTTSPNAASAGCLRSSATSTTSATSS